MTSAFEDLPWHDAAVLSIEIDRRQAGVKDDVRIEMVWPDGRLSTIVFLDCYALSASMNFGIVASETVRSATEAGDDSELERHRSKWSKLGVDLSKLRKFTIETNSTASTVVVFALRWEERRGHHDDSIESDVGSHDH
jgi:hypothetical protein